MALLLAGSATAAPARGRVDLEASVDRVEEAFLVLDAPPHPSLPVPERTGRGNPREGDAVRVTIESDRLGAWRVTRVESSSLTLVDADGQFRWPRSLAPVPLSRGDRVRFEVKVDPVRGARTGAAIRALQERAESP